MLWLFQRIGIWHGTIFPLYCITIAFEVARPRLEIVARPPQPPAQFALELDLKVRVLRPACQIVELVGIGRVVVEEPGAFQGLGIGVARRANGPPLAFDLLGEGGDDLQKKPR